VFKLTESKLAAQIIRIVGEIDPSVTARYDPEQQQIEFFDVDGGDGPSSQLFIGNIYAQAKGKGMLERKRWLRSVLAEWSRELLLRPDKLLASLRIRIRTRYELALKKRLAAGRGPSVESMTRTVGDLLIETVSDRVDTVAVYSAEQFAEAGVTEDEAFRVAAAAMARMTDADQWKEIEQGIWISTYSDDYDFARLVALADDARLPFGGTPIVFAPSHSVCLISDRDDPQTLDRLVNLGIELSSDHRPLSQLLWVRAAPGEWREFRPADDHPSAGIAAALRLGELSLQYEEQRFVMEQEFEDRGEDAFVAGFVVARGETEQFTISTYTFDIPTYLPRTEMVAVVNPHAATDEDATGMMPWEEFLSVMGEGSVKPMPGEDPLRFMVLDPLTPEQRSELFARRKPIAMSSRP